MEFHKIDRLPKATLKLLFEKGKEDKRNYIKEYLNGDVEEIKSECPLYSGPSGTSNVLLPKGELVYIKEVKGNWYRIEFEKNESIQHGWIEKKYLK